MTVDVELTLNRFGLSRVGPNKIQVGFLRVAWWEIPTKHSVGFELNWRRS